MLFSLAFTGLAILIAEYIGKETAIVFTKFLGLVSTVSKRAHGPVEFYF
jgi:hypothetical protein